MQQRRKIIVIGAGAAGLMAAAAACDAGADVTIYEKNEKAGKKIYITGKGRCNYSNACETADFFDHVVTNPRFLYSAIYDFDQSMMTAFLEENGCPTKVERGLRCFPVSDHASDVTRALTTHLRHGHAKIVLNTGVRKILTEELAGAENRVQKPEELTQDPEESVRDSEIAAQDPEESVRDSEIAAQDSKKSAQDPKTLVRGEKNQPSVRVTGVELMDGSQAAADAVIVATGGLSYPSTGSTGDGYRFAEALGMDIRPQAPALVPFTVREHWPLELQGLSLKNVEVSLVPADTGKGIGDEDDGDHAGKRRHPHRKPKPVYQGFGEMMFTHFGVTGPLILSASSYADFDRFPQGYTLHLDLKPALTQEQLEDRIQREMEASSHKSLLHAMRPLFPERLDEVVCRLFAVSEWERRGQTGGSPERSERSERSESLERSERSERSESLERSERSERSESLERSTRSERSKSLEGSKSPERSAEADRAVDPGRAEAEFADDFVQRKAYTFNRAEQKALAALIKNLTMTVTGTRGFAEAIITRGGVNVKEINPSTMEARKVRGLYFAGEVLDVNAQTGGYNLQIAWSTGHLAGTSAAEGDS